MTVRRWVYGAAGALAVGVLVPAYAFLQAVPAPRPTAALSLKAATRLARQAAAGTVLTAGSSTIAGQLAYVFRIRSPKGQVQLVTVNGANGQVHHQVLVSSITPKNVQAAEKRALAVVPQSRVLTTTAAKIGETAVYQVLVANPSGQRWSVAVAAATGAVLGVHRLTTGSPPPPVSRRRAEQLAVAAVGGGQAIDLHQSEPNDHGQRTYVVTVLLPTSAHVNVKVSPAGRILAVGSASGS